MKSKIHLGNTLIDECIRILNLSTDDNGCIIKDGIRMNWNDLESISLFNPIPYENDKIDGVLLFGDCTIEFHFENDCDTTNWSKFSNDYIMMVIKELQNNQCTKFV